MLSCRRCARATPLLRQLLSRSFAAHPAVQLVARDSTNAPAHHDEPQELRHGNVQAASAPGNHPTSTSANPSRRRLKRRSISPAKDLTASLQATGNVHGVPAAPETFHKLDFSYFDPIAVVDQSRLDQARRMQQPRAAATPPRMSLQTITAAFIAANAANPGTSFTPTQEQADLLQRRHYTVHDVQDWAAILSGEEAVEQAAHMLAHTNTDTADAANTKLKKKMKKPLPTFVFLYFLRRPYLPPHALRHLLAYAWWIQRHRSGEAHPFPPMNAQSCFIAIVRLIRHARVCLPEALFSIARLFVRFCATADSHPAASNTSQNARALARQRKTLTRLNALYNRVLSLLSLPSSPHPFADMPLHQRAQFECLRSMANHRPPLSTNREGYRAIARVQLANSKTPQERDWAEMKSRSWPPWKQDRTGFDVEKEFDYGTSRALEAIQRGIQAGYASRNWEKAAKILSGWDIDGSPTIQTRAILLHRDVLAPSYEAGPTDDSMIWQMRIVATRTLPEAWAAFLEWKEQQLPPYAPVYSAMLTKIAADSKRTRAEQRHDGHAVAQSQVLPGDGIETTAPPASDSEGIYVREPAPTFDELAEDMYHAGIVPTDSKLLVLLLHNAASVEDLIKYLKWACQKDARLTSLLNEHADAEQLGQVDAHVFTAYILALCRAATGYLTQLSSMTVRFPFRTALQLLFGCQPRYPGPWQAVAQCLATGGPILELAHTPHLGQDQHVYRWRLMQGLYERMHKLQLLVTAPTVLAMCRCLESAARLARVNLQDTEPLELTSIGESTQAVDAAQVLASGSGYIRERFHELFPPLNSHAKSSVNRLVTSEGRDIVAESQEKLDVLIPASPDLVLLHAYIRVQGTLRAWQELLTSAEWMVAHRHAINRCVEDSASAQAMLRKCLVALRVFAEGKADTATTAANETDDDRVARPKKRRRLQQLVESVTGWGGWPVDQECMRYVQGENPLKHRRVEDKDTFGG